MPTLTPQQQALTDAKGLFRQEVGALGAGANSGGLSPELTAAYLLLRTSPDSLWSLYDDKGVLSPRLQYLYASRHALDVLIRAVAFDVNYAEAGAQESLSDESKNLIAARTVIDAELTVLEQQVRANGGIAIGVMTTTQPRLPCAPWQPNPASGYFRGDPLSRGPWEK